MTFNCFKCGSGSIQRVVVNTNTSTDAPSLPARDAARTLRRIREQSNQIEQNSNQYVNALAEALNPNTTATANSNAPVQCGPVADNSDVIDRLMFFSGCSLPTGRGTVAAAPIGVRAPRPPGKKPSALCKALHNGQELPVAHQ